MTSSGVQPTVLILGGFLTSPPLYWRLAARLRERGVRAVVIAPVWTPEWVLGLRGLGGVLARADRALTRAAQESAAEGDDAPVLIVGHSAGGFLARMLTSPVAYAGLSLDRHRQIGAIVTLGTPHRAARWDVIGDRIDRLAGAFVDEAVPGAYFAPAVGYVAVGSRAVVGSSRGFGRGRLAELVYRRLHPSPDDTPIEGDGLVPLACTELLGARWIVLRGFVHGQLAGRPWYGSPEAVDAWWPVALDSWRDALAARASN